jgi:predicted deacylase
MPDDVTVNGVPVVTDEAAGGKHIQVFKESDGGDGSRTFLARLIGSVFSSGSQYGKLGVGVRRDTPTPLTGVDDGDVTAQIFDALNRMHVRAHIPAGRDLAFDTASIDYNTSGDKTVVSSSSGKKVYVSSVVLISQGTLNIRWKSDANNKSGAIALTTEKGFSASGDPCLVTNASQALILNLGSSVQVSGWVTWAYDV